MGTPSVVVVPYRPEWPEQFETLRARLWPHLVGVATAIEHVGSTSVPGLAAKPIIDLDIVVLDDPALSIAIARLATLGYRHLGNLDVAGREAFAAPPDPIRHNLYACPQHGIGLRNHLALRERLRQNTDLRDQYATLKLGLAQRHPDSIDAYVDGKTAFIVALLSDSGLTPDDLQSIRDANTLKPAANRSDSVPLGDRP